MKAITPTCFVACIFICLVSCSVLAAAPADSSDVTLSAPTGWSGERIALPPRFAPDMKLKGVEEIRFAPGMFKAKSDSFFSYVLVFQVSPKPELTKEIMHRELLAYYRGLASAVLRGRDVAVDPKDFTLKLTGGAAAKDADGQKGLTSYRGELKWVEPFVTRKKQTLHFEIEAWQDTAAQNSYLFIIASPQAASEPIWSTMRSIRKRFHEARK